MRPADLTRVLGAVLLIMAMCGCTNADDAASGATDRQLASSGDTEPSGASSQNTLPTPDRPPGDDVESRREAMLRAFSDVGVALIELRGARAHWVSGELSDAAWLKAAEGAELRIEDARPAVGRLDVGDERATRLYVASLDVHVAALVVDRAAASTEGELREAAQDLGARLRLLGDRVFDVAQARVGLMLGTALTSPVPDWSEFELVPAAPVDAGNGTESEEFRAAAALEAREEELAKSAEAKSPGVVRARLALLLRAEAFRVSELESRSSTEEPLAWAVTSLRAVADILDGDTSQSATEHPSPIP